ncbi:hypothetical protein EBL_c07150 [Shimwellia blattae DSM 4481 = NBRC 105725]|uniref:Uncharacterized protein n=1 Tax=Shimwellia blattae (strain ATCC 29907 / DSM 4481 / JCM 1650 / NBRC 105725 / CDC 9005-74) TaxID=630626 RepID=I2B5N4_SHIBC|nr:hypothetical protein EBL_c07150 [Shimwellia blattae DSM 4481 = NBRC 105725]
MQQPNLTTSISAIFSSPRPHLQSPQAANHSESDHCGPLAHYGQEVYKQHQETEQPEKLSQS